MDELVINFYLLFNYRYGFIELSAKEEETLEDWFRRMDAKYKIVGKIINNHKKNQ